MEKLTIEEREKQFRAIVAAFDQQYDHEMLTAFSDYWTEPNRSKTKMLFELQKTWDTARRLRTWLRNNNNWNKNNNGKSNSKSAADTIINIGKAGQF
jgi:hypothetical protein